MNTVDVLTRKQPAHSQAAQPLRRPPPRAVKILLPVWGYSYVRHFLDCGLPTLLAPGNVPAIAAALPTQFVLLTGTDDADYIRRHNSFKRLAAVCDVEIRAIDHLITDGNYSTTITLAYTEAVRRAGAAMLDTCFFFLVSDYVMADGSLANAVRRMQEGASAVTVGNFQVVREDALPWLRRKVAKAGDVLALSPRELMHWALNHLHPVMLANMVNVPFSHNSHTNRLFWRVDENTIIGRFYLMHMLCVRPERTDFVIGSSCDYSFIPEMCPSGNTQAITDSDEYLVIEMQPRGHEGKFLQRGPLKPARLAKSLSEWATKEHRANVRHCLVFHGGDVPDLRPTLKQADAFVRRVTSRLSSRPRPHRGHAYWRGALAEFYDATGRRFTDTEWRRELGLTLSSNRLLDWLLWHARYSLMGQPPSVTLWHPAWPDLRAALNEIAPFFHDDRQRLLILSNEATPLSLGLADNGYRVIRIRCKPFMRHPERYKALTASFDFCLLELHEEVLWQCDELLHCVTPLMKPNSHIIVFARNRRRQGASSFSGIVAFHAERLLRPGLTAEKVYFIAASGLRWSIIRSMARLELMARTEPWIGLPAAGTSTAFLLLGSVVANLDALLRGKAELPPATASSCIIRLRVGRPGLIEDAPPAIIAALRRDSETDSKRLLKFKDSVGPASLGLYVGQIWHENPGQLGVLLARYKFIAKTLSGVDNVGEVGCRDAFCSRVVGQEIPDITVYDRDAGLIEDAQTNRDRRWPLKAVVHDIIEGPLPRSHAALFSLDMFDRILAAEQHGYLANMCRSLAPDGVLIVGTANAPALAGPAVDGKSGSELRELLEHYFARVSLVSMCDEASQPGLNPAADYLLAICTNVKRTALN